jgi:hypothetical protein
VDGSGKVSDFEVDVAKFAKKLELDIGVVLKKVGVEVYDDLTRMTPVDTGRARASWNMQKNRINTSVRRAGRYTSSGGSRRTSNAGRTPGASIVPRRMKPTDTIFISNNLPYIKYLERGSSKQAPRGMMKVVRRRWRGYINRAVRNVA